MDTILNFMDAIYSDSKALTIVYVIGAILLLIFIILLIVSLKKPSNAAKKEIKKETTAEKTEEVKTEIKEETVEKHVETIPEKEEVKTDEISNIPNTEPTVNNENAVAVALNNVENKMIEPEETAEEKIDESALSADIPNVDDFVDNVVKKTYEKNGQFSSVYVGNTTSIKLDKVLDNLNVDENVKEAIVPADEKSSGESETNITPEENVQESENKMEETHQSETNTVSSLDKLKQSLEEKKKETNETVVNADDLKAKLAGLSKTVEEKVEDKSEEAMNPEDLLKKLNAMKEK